MKDLTVNIVNDSGITRPIEILFYDFYGAVEKVYNIESDDQYFVSFPRTTSVGHKVIIF